MAVELRRLFGEDEDLQRTFELVAKERKIRFEDLTETLGTGKSAVLGKLHQLEKEDLIKSQASPGQMEGLQWYSVTAKGLRTERELHRGKTLL